MMLLEMTQSKLSSAKGSRLLSPRSQQDAVLQAGRFDVALGQLEHVQGRIDGRYLHPIGAAAEFDGNLGRAGAEIEDFYQRRGWAVGPIAKR